MSYQQRYNHRLELFALFIREIAQMDKELARLAMEWSISLGILLLIFNGQVTSTAGIPAVTVIMSIDFARLYAIYKGVKTGQLDVSEVDNP